MRVRGEGLVIWAALALVALPGLLDGGSTYGAVTLVRLGLLWLVAAWLWRGVGQGVILRRQTPLDLPLLLLGLVAAVAVLRAPYAAAALYWFAHLASGALLFWLVASVQEPAHEPRLTTGLLAVGAGQAALTLGQWATGSLPRPSGTFFNPNYLAAFVAPLAVLALARALARAAPTWTRAGTGALALGLGAAALATASRGGLLALGVGAGWVLGMGRRGRLLALGLAALVSLALLVPSMAVRWRGLDPYGYARWQMWRASVAMVRDHPWGVGLGMYQYVFPRYSFPVEGPVGRYAKVARDPHSEFVQVGAELGWPGWLLLGWTLAVLIALAWRTAPSLQAPGRAEWLGITGALLALLTQATVDATLHEPPVFLLLALLAGLLAARAGAVHSIRLAPSSRPLVATTVVLVTLASTAWVGTTALAHAFARAGDARLARGEVEPAMARYRRAVALAPGSSAYRDSLARAYLAQSEQRLEPARRAWLDQAQQAVDAALVLNPVHDLLWKHRAYLHEVAGAPDLALQAYARAAALSPFNPFYAFQQGRLALQLGRPGRAEAAFARAAALEPNFFEARYQLARVWEQQGRVEEARAQYRALLQLQQRHAGAPPPTEYERALLRFDPQQAARRLAALGG